MMMTTAIIRLHSRRLCNYTNNKHKQVLKHTLSTLQEPNEQFAPINRWTKLPPANLVHLSIGAVYTYTMWIPGLTSCCGVVCASHLDWSLSEVLPVFSTAAVTLGITTSLLGSWVERVGPRVAGVCGSISWGSALAVTGLGVEYHSLPLVYAGYGFLGGIGWGLCYLTPVSTVMKWFPDRRGLATGIALSAFGLGAAIAPPVIQSFTDYFFVAPDFIGSSSEVLLETVDGTQVVSIDSPLGEPNSPVVVATAMDCAKVSSINNIIEPGVYALNTGDSGLSKSFMSLGLIYGGVGSLASTMMQGPPPGWKPDGFNVIQEKSTSSSQNDEINLGIKVNEAVSTRQFFLLWLSVFGNATGGLALLSSSKVMITDIWSGAMPDIVTASFATGYVAALGTANAVGRFGWAYASDFLGRQNKLFALGIPIVGLAPYLCHTSMNMIHEQQGNSNAISTMIPLGGFVTGSVITISFYGGIFSVLPAYIADLFGQKHSGAIHGKALTAWAASAVLGPMGLASLRSHSENKAIVNLIDEVDDATFENTFNSGKENVQSLIDSKIITINRLMEIAPPGTLDPTPYLYDTTCYMAAGLIGVSAIANAAIKPLDFAPGGKTKK